MGKTMKYINLLTDKSYIIYRDCYNERISEIRADIKVAKELLYDNDEIILKMELEIKILKTHIRHMDELQALARQMYPNDVKATPVYNKLNLEVF